MERKLATVRKIDEINPIEGADAIEVATVGGWKVVVKKGEFQPGDLALYLEIDSWVPESLAPFLVKGKEAREYNGVKGERLRTVKLRGQISQGLLLPHDIVWDKNMFDFNRFGEGDDVTEYLGVQKWEKPISAQLAGSCKGNFPSLIRKTDQERVQNLRREIEICRDQTFEVTEKLEGSSMTCYVIDGEFGVCSRNMDLKRDENNSFWKVAIRDNIEEKMLARKLDFAIQGELIGPGVQGNIYKLKDHEFRVFDVYLIKNGTYMFPSDREILVESLGLLHVPVLDDRFTMNDSIDALLKLAEGRSRLADVEREGLVFKSVYGEFSFKAISNKYLLKSDR